MGRKKKTDTIKDRVERNTMEIAVLKESIKGMKEDITEIKEIVKEGFERMGEEIQTLKVNFAQVNGKIENRSRQIFKNELSFFMKLIGILISFGGLFLMGLKFWALR